MKAETLKKSILQYAMQGKLVAQNPDDEPAGELLKRIKAEKEKLIKEGKIKKEKPLPPITEEEIPYKLPQGWEWVRLGDISTINGGYAFKSQNYINSGVRVIRISDFDEAGFKQGKIVYYEENQEYDNFVIDNNDILLAMTGGTVGKSYYVSTLGQKMYVNQRVADIKIDKIVNSKYINFLILSPLTQDKISACKNSTNDNISMLDIRSFYVPLPPLAEQQRIVEKLEQILPLIEEYGKNEEKLSELNKTLPDKIKQSVLQYAVQGKLVPQNPKDEPASELLKRIKAEKEKLIKEGKIKREKPLPPITEEEIPHELPQGWEWVRLGNLIELTSGQDLTPNMHNDEEKGIPYITGASNIANGQLIINRWTTYGRAFAYAGNLLLTCKGTVGTMFILDCAKVHIARQIMGINTLSNLSVKYTNIFLETYINNLKSSAKSIIPGISRNDVLEIAFPLPPLAEQQRIVEKLEQLLPLIEELG